MVNSRRKGKDGELEAARALREHLGLPVTRAAQHSGKEQADLRGTPGIHWEVKRVRRLGVARYVEQAYMDKVPTDVPVVLMREDANQWFLLIPLADVDRFLQRLSASRTLPEVRQ